MPLAIRSYEDLPELFDDDQNLILAWTSDERSFLSADLNSVISAALTAEINQDLPHVNRYLVKDPYGEDYLGPAVERFFSRSQEAYCVMCGAGVISLLQSIAGLAKDRAVVVIGSVYPDFPYWVERASGRCISCPSTGDDWRNLEFPSGSLVFFERPSLMGDFLDDLTEVYELCRKGAANNALIVIDESNANYYPAAFSAVNLLDRAENLIVLRGFSKAYGLGGLRLSYCVSSMPLRTRLRQAMPPLLASSLSLYLGRRVLELGDITQPLRRTIKQRKAEVTLLLERYQLSELLPSSERLPYLFVRNSESYVRSRFDRRGIVGKLHTTWSGGAPALQYLYRLSVPLQIERFEVLKQKLASDVALDKRGNAP